MAWGTGRCDVPALRNFNEAKAFWEKQKPWSGYGSIGDYRQLDDSRKKKHVALAYSEASLIPRVRCKLHSTDVITYYADGSIFIDTHASTLTDSFAAQLLARTHGIECEMKAPIGPVVWVDHVEDGWRGYRAREISIKPADGHGKWTVEETHSRIDEIEDWTVDAAKARASLREYPAYREYQNWMQAAAAMGHRFEHNNYHKLGYMEVLTSLKNGTDEFTAIAEDGWSVDDLRMAIYYHHEVTVCRRWPYLGGDWHGMNHWKRHAALKGMVERSSTWGGIKYRVTR